MNDPLIRPLEPADLDEAVRLLGVLNPDAAPGVLRGRLEEILREHPNYRLAGAFVDGRLAGVGGAWIATRIWCGRYLEIDNLVVDPDLRSSGVGTRLIGHFEAVARGLDCRVITMDAYTFNHGSHRLYHRLGFEIWGFHFIKPIGDWAGRDGA